MTTEVTTTAPATEVAPARQITPIQSLARTLEGPYAEKIKAALDGTGISPERFTRTALAALNANKYLVEKCSRDSIIVSVMNAASLGLELNPAMGHAAIVPRGSDAVLQVQYKGKIHLAQQHPKIAAVAVGTIHEKDRYEFCEGTHPELKVWPALGDRGAPISYYCVTHYADGVAVCVRRLGTRLRSPFCLPTPYTLRLSNPPPARTWLNTRSARWSRG